MVRGPSSAPSRGDRLLESGMSIAKGIGSVGGVMAHTTKSLADVLLMVSEPQHIKSHAKNLGTNIVDIGENIYGVGNGIVTGVGGLGVEIARGGRDALSTILKKIYKPALDRKDDTHILNKGRRGFLGSITKATDELINKPIDTLTVDRIDPTFKAMRDFDAKISVPYMRVAA